MPLRFALPLVTAAVLAVGAAFPVAADAQLRFSIDVHDSTMIVRQGQLIDMKATITNQDVAPINVRAVRFRNDLPGLTWYTAMCFGEQCFPPDMDFAPPARIEMGGSVEFKLTVGTVDTVYDYAEVRAAIRFDTGEGSPGVEQEFVVVFDGTASAPGEQRVTIRSARPNPARTSAIVPLEPADLSAATARLQLVDALGRTVVDLPSVEIGQEGIRLDVSNVAEGAYFYRVDVDGALRTGRLVVAH